MPAIKRLLGRLLPTTNTVVSTVQSADSYSEQSAHRYLHCSRNKLCLELFLWLLVICLLLFITLLLCYENVNEVFLEFSRICLEIFERFLELFWINSMKDFYS